MLAIDDVFAYTLSKFRTVPIAICYPLPIICPLFCNVSLHVGKEMTNNVV